MVGADKVYRGRSTLGGGGGGGGAASPTSYTAILHSFQLRQSCISDWKNVHGTTCQWTLCRIPHLFFKRAGDLANSQHVIVIASMINFGAHI